MSISFAQSSKFKCLISSQHQSKPKDIQFTLVQNTLNLIVEKLELNTERYISQLTSSFI